MSQFYAFFLFLLRKTPGLESTLLSIFRNLPYLLAFSPLKSTPLSQLFRISGSGIEPCGNRDFLSGTFRLLVKNPQNSIKIIKKQTARSENLEIYRGVSFFVRVHPTKQLLCEFRVLWEEVLDLFLRQRRTSIRKYANSLQKKGGFYSSLWSLISLQTFRSFSTSNWSNDVWRSSFDRLPQELVTFPISIIKRLY